MALHHSMRSSLGGLLAVSLLAVSLAPALASQSDSRDPPNIYDPSFYGHSYSAPGGEAPWTANHSTVAFGGGGEAPNICPQVLAQPDLYRPRVVDECDRGAVVE
jgi:hypothetical protein